MNKTIKVLHTEWSDGWGGQEIRVIGEMLAVREQGVKVFLACREQATIRQKALEHRIPVFTLPFRGNVDFKTLFALKKLVRQHQIDIINTHSGKDTWVGGLAAKLSGVKFIRTRHLSNRIRANRTNFINELADYIFTTGESVRADMIQYNRIKPDRIQSIPTGIDADVFNPELYDRAFYRQKFDLQKDKIVIGIIAVLRQFKRHDLFLRAAKNTVDKYPDKEFTFLIAGDGPMKEDIEKLVSELNLQTNVVMLGHIDDVPQLLSALDIFVLTSDSKEGVPQSIMQALMMNIPVVATNVGSTKDLFFNNFILVEPNVNSISLGVSSLVSDEQKRNTLSKEARYSIVKNFSKDSMARRILEVYKELV